MNDMTEAEFRRTHAEATLNSLADATGVAVACIMVGFGLTLILAASFMLGSGDGNTDRLLILLAAGWSLVLVGGRVASHIRAWFRSHPNAAFALVAFAFLGMTQLPKIMAAF